MSLMRGPIGFGSCRIRMGMGGVFARGQAVKAASCAPAISIRRCGAMPKRCRGVPAAAQTCSKVKRCGSKNARGCVRCPTGDTPPMAKPVCARMSAASALPSASPATVLARASSTRLAPEVTKRIAVPLSCPRNMIDLAICAISQPTRSAAICAVVALPISTGVISSPASCSARVTRARLLLMVVLRFFPLISTPSAIDQTCAACITRAMTFTDRLTRLPRPYDPAEGEEARAALPDLTGPLSDLLAGAGGCSPFLKTLILQEAAWLGAAFDAPEAALTGLFDALKEVPPDRLGAALREAKRRVALLTGLADLAGVWSLEEVTGRLTDFADLACDLALKSALATEIRRGKLPGISEDDIATGAGMVVIAMGKMGAHELNYSSDIDLICLFDETRFDRDDFHEARASFVRATRKMSALLSDRTAEGYVFRTDLRLRPDSGVTPVCMAMAAAETYYESLGRTWERAAYIKARACAGDFAAIEDAHNMRLAIREHKGLGGRLCLEGHNMKLGRGGIREIEFFTQTRQLIAGGRDTDLRVRGTVPGLARLAEKGWIPESAAEKLIRHYRFHREVEHRVQMLRDAQTHLLPNSAAEFDRLAAFMGRDAGDLRTDLEARLTEVHDLIEGFFAQDTCAEDCAVPDALA